MRRKSLRADSPNLLLATLGGAVATILVTAMIYFAPAIGFPLIDLPLLIGGLFTSNVFAAFWLGYAIFFIGGWILVPIVLKELWTGLPGDRVRFRGAVLKGALFGAVLWIPSGLLLGLLAASNQISGAGEVGFFAAGHGVSGALALFAGHVAYGVSLAVVMDMGQGLSPIDAMGWLGHGAGREA